MNLNQRMREQDKARKWWAGLSHQDKWEVGDQLVLHGTLSPDWFDGKAPTTAFVNQVERERIHWEETSTCY